MKRLFAFLLILPFLLMVGCRSQHINANREAPYEQPISTNSPDPFMSLDYSSDEIGRPYLEQQREATHDPFDEYFHNLGSFGNIGESNPFMRSEPQSAQTNQDVAETPSGNYSTPAYNYTDNRNPASLSRGPAPVTPVAYGTGSTNLVAVSEPGPHHISLIFPSPEYGIIKLDKIVPNEVSIDQPFKYTIVVTNLTDTILSSVTLTEYLADNYSFESADPLPQQMGKQLLWRMESLGPKASEQIIIYGRPKDINVLKNNTTLTYSAVAPSNIRVVKPELELSRNVPRETLLSDSFQVEYIIKNVGSGSARDVKIIESLPSGLTTTSGANEVKFDVGALRGGEERRYTAELRASRSGVFANKALALSSSNTRAESAATATSVRQPVLVISKSGPERQYLGRPLSYEITVINKGDGIAQNTTLEDSIPIDVSGVEASAGADVTGSHLHWDLGSIAPNSSKTVRVSYKPNQVGIYTSDTTVMAHSTEAVTSKTRTTVVGIPVVSLDVVDLDDPVEVGGNVTYVITATNDGSAPDHNLRVVCQLEDKLNYVSSSGSSEASMMGRTISFTQVRTLAPKTKATWRIICKAVAPGGVRFKVTLTSDVLTRPVEETEATYLYE